MMCQVLVRLNYLIFTATLCHLIFSRFFKYVENREQAKSVLRERGLKKVDTITSSTRAGHAKIFRFVTATTRQLVRASVTTKIRKMFKSSVSKWSNHNEYSHTEISNHFWPENIVTFSR